MGSTFKKLLTRIVDDFEVETQWLNLLSQLEYVGCRKIIKSVDLRDVNGTVLQHIAEEALHSQLLRQLVENRDPKAVSWVDSPWSEIGWTYFQTVDRKCCELVQEQRWHYPLVSWVIEQRVLWLYPWYLEQTRDEGVKRVLRRILVQEQRHADQFQDIAAPAEARAQGIKIEEQAWESFASQLLMQADVLGEPKRERPPLI